MVDILHKVGVKAEPDEVYAALATRKGLAGWWTTDTHGESAVDEVLQFRFEQGGADMQVVELQPDKRVAWRVVGGPDEWLGTELTFDLAKDGDYTSVLFKHGGWREPVDFMHHCSTKWAVYLLSLKKLLETGRGEPAPNDVQISNWH